MRLSLTLFLSVVGGLPLFAAPGAVPNDFPRFHVPGQDKEMAVLRQLLWLHYAGAGPKATLWDEWLSSAAFWPATAERNLADEMRRHRSLALSHQRM